jgi:hypothetical protein
VPYSTLNDRYNGLYKEASNGKGNLAWLPLEFEELLVEIFS